MSSVPNATALAFSIGLALYVAVPAANAVCTGDCNDSSTVSALELFNVTCRSVICDGLPTGTCTCDTSTLAPCPAGDGNGDGKISVLEIFQATQNSVDENLRMECSPPPTPVISAMTWQLHDGCDDDLPILYRLFDVDNHIVFPSLDLTYPVGGQTAIGCKTGASICYGAEPDPPNGAYWGIGLDGTRSCSQCCFDCDQQKIQVTLTCP